MTACHPLPETSSAAPHAFDEDHLNALPLEQLPQALAAIFAACAHAGAGPLPFHAFEPQLCQAMAVITRRALASALASFDLDMPHVRAGDTAFRRVYRGQAPYLTQAGEVHVTRSLYRPCASDDTATVCPLEMNTGVIAGYWTPAAAKLATFALTVLTPTDAHALFARAGQMSPSRACLARVIAPIHDMWEGDRMNFEYDLTQEDAIPQQACVLAASLDGVMLPMTHGDKPKRKADAQAKEKSGSGPIGYKEAGCATLSLYDDAGERLKTLYYGRMPQAHKDAVKDWLYEEVKRIKAQRPDLRLIGIADGAKDNWSCLQDDLGCDILTLDFYHATEHLKVACDAAFKDKKASKAAYEKWRRILLEEEKGAEEVIKMLKRLNKKRPKNKVIARERQYFEQRKEQMGYAARKARGEPIGSGVVEAACKTLVVERMRRSGMRWSQGGGQAIMTWRALVLSRQFDRAWALVSARFVHPVSAPQNIIPLNRHHAAFA